MMVLFSAAIILSPLSFAVPHFQKETSNTSQLANNEFTHTVFCELGTATWCGPCVRAHTALQNIYESGDYPFYYVAMIDDVSADAHRRLDRDLNLRGFPTTYYDGGHTVAYGGYPDEQYYRTPLEQSGVRPVPNITMNVTMDWIDDAVVTVNATIENEDAEEYTGTLRAYIVEPVSRYKNANTDRYDFGFLDWAINDEITIPAGDESDFSSTWDGNDHGFGDIGRNNIMVIAAVFNSEKHIGYSDPPKNLYPFDAYYVDETAAATPPPASDEEPPIVSVVQPKLNMLYLFGEERRELQRNTTLIIGSVIIEINASDNESGMDHVDLYIDDTLVTNWTTPPYTWEWTESVFFKHTIRAVASDVVGNKAEKSLEVWKFF